MATATDAPASLEPSAPLGAFLLLAGVAIPGGHHLVGLFPGWTWALFAGGFTIAAGLSVLRPDVRHYRSLPFLDALVADGDSEDR